MSHGEFTAFESDSSRWCAKHARGQSFWERLKARENKVVALVIPVALAVLGLALYCEGLVNKH